MADSQEQFDDPALRSALKRAMPKPVAPAHLRENVAAMMHAAPEPAPRRAPSRWRLPELPRISFGVGALAAIVLVALGLAGMQVWSFVEDFLPHSSTARVALKLNAAVKSDVVKAHDNCAKLPDHHLIAGNTPEFIRAKLTQGEGVTVFATSLDAGWEFKGGGICQVGDAKAAHLLFARGDELASVFTLPSANSGCMGGEYYDDELELGHAVSTSSHAGAMYVVVVSKTNGADAPKADAQSLSKFVQCHLSESPAATAPTTMQ